MKKTFKRALALAACMCMPMGMCVTASAASDAAFAHDWQYVEDESGSYWMLDAVYVKNPVEDIQHLVIYAPEAYMIRTDDGVAVNRDGAVASSTGVTYTALNAPIMYHNSSGGYAASAIQSVNMDYLNEGYVHVTVATRGKESRNAAGEYIGQFPAILVDLKAGVRFLKAFDGELPGNANAIISRGYSSGGALSAMLGVSGNSPVFDGYLAQIGAYDAGDDIFMALASGPITNLSTVDASYEWYQGENVDYFLFNAMAKDREGNAIEGFETGRNVYHVLGDNVLGGAHEDELSRWLYDWSVDYIQGLGFDLGDDGRSGEYYEGLVKVYEDSLAAFTARYDQVKGVLHSAPDTVNAYLESLTQQTSTGRAVADPDWFTVDESGAVTMKSLDAIMINHAGRNKMAPSSDSYNYASNENNVFVTADGTPMHFSPVVKAGLAYLLEHPDPTWSKDDLTYLKLLNEDYANVSAGSADAELLEIMSPINYVIGTYQGDKAPYIHWRIGSGDPDHGLPNAWLVHNALLKYNPEVKSDIAVSWGMGHGPAELTEQDMYDYVSAAMTESGRLNMAEN